jgi:hypothetical protein
LQLIGVSLAILALEGCEHDERELLAQPLDVATDSSTRLVSLTWSACSAARVCS